MNTVNNVKQEKETNEVTVIPPKEKKIKKIDRPQAGQIISPENLIMTAVQNGASIDMLERLLSMRERIQKENAEIAFRDAMSAFQAECPIIPKTKKVMNKKEKGGGERYRYATLDSIVKLIQPLLSKHGFSYNIKTEIIDKPFAGIHATIFIFHLAGHSETSSFDCPMDKEAYMTEPQKWLSAATFAKRIIFCNGFGIMTGDEDNDANIDNPEDKAKKEQSEAERKAEAENVAKINALPENVKKGFELLGYKTIKAKFELCNMYSWDNDKIYKRLREIADGKK